jgi:DNA invertase Pin-like site-specific DNA recombinase
VTSYFLKTFIDLVGAKDELQEIKRMVSVMKSKSNKEIITMLAGEGFKQVNIAKALGITKQAVYKVLKSTESQQSTKK